MVHKRKKMITERNGWRESEIFENLSIKKQALNWLKNNEEYENEFDF